MNVVKDKINKGILKFLEKKEAMVVNEGPFPLISTINISSVADLKESSATEKAKEQTPIPKVKQAWVPKKCLYHINEPLAPIAKGRKDRGYFYSAPTGPIKMVRQITNFSKDSSKVNGNSLLKESHSTTNIVISEKKKIHSIRKIKLHEERGEFSKVYNTIHQTQDMFHLLKNGSYGVHHLYK